MAIYSTEEQQRLIRVGAENGKVPTYGMPSQKAQETDALVNKGKSEK